jgi:Rieske Fe-S protein
MEYTAGFSQMPRTLSISAALAGFLALASVASADPVPVLDWSGVANVTGGFGFSPANANVTTNGLAAYDNWYDAVGGGGESLSANYQANTAFTVTSPGDFQLSGIGSFSLYAATCNHSGCTTIGEDLQPLEIDLTATVSILNSMGNTVATESFSGSASAPYGSCQLFPEFNQENCFADANLNASIPSGIFELSTGNYTLDVNVSPIAHDVFGTVVTGGPSVEGDVIPITTPEPREWWMLLALSALLCAAKMRLGRKRRGFVQSHSRR